MWPSLINKPELEIQRSKSFEGESQIKRKGAREIHEIKLSVEKKVADCCSVNFRWQSLFRLSTINEEINWLSSTPLWESSWQGLLEIGKDEREGKIIFFSENKWCLLRKFCTCLEPDCFSFVYAKIIPLLAMANVTLARKVTSYEIFKIFTLNFKYDHIQSQLAQTREQVLMKSRWA